MWGERFLAGNLIEIPCKRCRYVVWAYGLDRAYKEKDLRVLQYIDLDRSQIVLDKAKVLRRENGEWIEFPASSDLLSSSLDKWRAARRRAAARPS